MTPIPRDLLQDTLFGGKVHTPIPPEVGKYIRQINELPTVTKIKPAN